MQSPGEYGFFNQAKIMSGAGAMDNIPVELDGFDARRPFVLAGKEAVSAGLTKKFLKALAESNTVVGALYDDVPAYAGAGLVKDLAVFFRDRGCDSIISIGSGAVVDMAKGVNIAVSTGKDILDLEGENKIPGHLKPFVAVPTATVAPFDYTNMAHIDGRLFVSDFLYPDVIAIDPRTVRGCCAECVLATAMVALTHSVEAFLAPAHNTVNDTYAYTSIRFIADNLAVALKKPRNKAASLALVNAAVMAGVAFANSGAGMAHALGSALSSETGFSPGICMGVMLSHSIRYRESKKESFRGDLLMAMGGLDSFASTGEKDRGAKGSAMLLSFLGSIRELPRSLGDMKVPGYQARAAAQAAAKANPGLNARDCEAVMEMALAGSR